MPGTRNGTMPSELMDLRRESTIATSLEQHSSKSYPYIHR